MNPILLGLEVAQGLKDLVRDTLNATSPVFDGMVERFLAEPKNYLKGPWISVAMPFQQAAGAGEPFEQFFRETPLKYAPYLHQVEAFQRLSGPNPCSTLVATGTGSGKTESYLWPILDHCRANKEKPGVKAILIYPMNALATDQARRIAAAISSIPSLEGLRAGIYADSEPGIPTDKMTPDEVITKRSAMWDNPPDILLTNYKMLDYLLVRARDRRLWEQNAPETLRFLVVDEMHTFDGAQGADLALLVRRLKHRLHTPSGHLLCVGSSATLGSGVEAATDLIAYAERIFGESFDKNAVIRERRKKPDEVLAEPEYFDWPSSANVRAAFEDAAELDQAGAASRLAQVLFPDDQDAETAILHQDDANEPRWRLTLAKLLLEHAAVQRTLRIVVAVDGPISLDQMAQELCKVKALAGRSEQECAELGELLISLLSWARAGSISSLQPLFGIRVQIWAREMARMVTTMPTWGDDGQRTPVDLRHGADLDLQTLKQVLPIVSCSRCGTAGHLAKHAASSKKIWAGLDTLYEDFFEGSSDRIRLIYHEPVSRLATGGGGASVVPGFLDAGTMEFTPAPHVDASEAGNTTPVWLYNPMDQGGKLDRTCPACGHAQGLLLFGLRAARMTAALANSLYNSQQNEPDPQTKPRLLLFSDSVQDAAQRAAVAEIRNSGAVIRKALYRAITSSESKGLSLRELIEETPDALEAEQGTEAFVATFISSQQTWREPFQALLAEGVLPNDARFLRHVKLRLGWEFFSELTYRSHTSQTLEVGGLAVAEVRPELVREVAARLANSLPLNVGSQFVMPEHELIQFLGGLLQQMRRRGAVAHEYVAIGMANPPPTGGGVNYFAAGIALGLGKTSTLPVPSHRKGAAPRPVALGAAGQGYDVLTRESPTNWYRDWISKFFEPVSVLARARFADIFEEVMAKLESEQIVRSIDRPSGERGYVIEPQAIIVGADVQRLRCDRCNRVEITLAEADYLSGSPCTRIACEGTLLPCEIEPSRTLSTQLKTDRLHRIVGREHTGLLESDTRRKLETSFIRDETPWSPNLISATPTLEMGIDIGDLSTLLLCSVPPEEANYIQRIGRTGRRDGNSLNVTFANARAHDLQFWEDPAGMLSGKVRAPGVYLEAISVLRRQMAAFSLDNLVASGTINQDYGRVRPILKALENEATEGFPFSWFKFVEEHGHQLVGAFLGFLPSEVSARQEIQEAVGAFLNSRGEHSLQWIVRGAFDAVASERRHLQDLKKQLDAEAQRVSRAKATMTPEELQKRLNEIQGEKGEINQAITRGIDKVTVLQFLTDRGILPNYAFPEEGVKLTSILVRRSESGVRREDGEDLITLEYMRPASSALSEFAPGQSFYANGREVKIDRIDLDQRDRSSWRFCQRCSHAEQEAMSLASRTCPKCSDEMWADSGSLHTVINLRSVLAVTQEQKAAIQDSDDRAQRQHDRTIIPAYPESAIGAAWLTSSDVDLVPFGFEFISPCEFRDFNFGEKAGAPIGPKIAGEERQSNAFPICSHCGRLQNRFLGVDEPGEHQARCVVLKAPVPPPQDSWLSRIFLMRKFSTETMRIVVPVAGQATHDEIKSFVSGINLGMRRHFSGKVDHIRSVVVETQLDDRVMVRSLFLYDSVPGGSGYLRQLAEHPDSMRTVFTKAADALQSCSCAQEQKTGCFRCVKSYRSQFGPGEPDRDTALEMMQAVLSQWENLVQADRGINVSIKDSLVDSELEKRFLSALLTKFGDKCLTPQVLESGRKGFLLNTAPDGKGRFWTLETQVQIDKRFPGLPKKRVDFVLTPMGTAAERPIVVEMDGLEFHSATVDQDLIDRITMIRSGKVRVWTLGWDDLADTIKGSVPNPFSENALGAAHAGMLARALSTRAMAPFEAGLKVLAECSAFEGLLAALTSPVWTLAPASSILLRLVIAKGSDLASMPRVSALSSDGRTFLEGAAINGFCTSRNIDCYLGADPRMPGEWPEAANQIRVLVRGEFSKLSPGIPPTPDYIEGWRGLWRLVNFLQELRGFHIEFPGIDTIEAPSMEDGRATEVERAWEIATENVDPAFGPLIMALIAADLPPPDMIGLDIVSGGEVVGMAELVWTSVKLCVSEQAFEAPGWTIIEFDPGESETEGAGGQPMSAVVANIIAAIEGDSQ